MIIHISASLNVLGTLCILSHLLLLTTHFWGGETEVQKDHYFPEITEQLLFVFLLLYHDDAQWAKPEYSRENKNIKWKNMLRIRWLILHVGFYSDVVSSEGLLWPLSVKPHSPNSLSLNLALFFHSAYHCLIPYFIFSATNPDWNVRSTESVPYSLLCPHYPE